MWVPLQIKKNKKKTNKQRIKKKKKEEEQAVGQEEILFFYFYFFSLTSLFDIRKSDRQKSSGQEAKCSTQQGLRMGTKNTGFCLVFN